MPKTVKISQEKPKKLIKKEPIKKTTSLDKSAELVNDISPNEQPDNPIKATAKAGKRSTKAQREAAEIQAKAERKVSAEDLISQEKPKRLTQPTRSRLARSGKKLQQMAKKIEKNKLYDPLEALDLAIQTSPVKFDATVELHVNLKVDPKQADQNIRDSVVLPAGTGKSLRIAAFVDEKIDGADLNGIELITKELEKGTIDFNVLIATPATMPKLGKFARLLGPRGLMPNPKSGTVTNDIFKAVAEAKAGRVEYRVDSTGIVHMGIGKVSFGKDRLLKNFEVVIASIKYNKPASVKDHYIKSVHVTTSMGPSIAVDYSNL